MIWEFSYPDDFGSTGTDTSASTPSSYCDSEDEGEVTHLPRHKNTFIDETSRFLSNKYTYSRPDRRRHRSSLLTQDSEHNGRGEDLMNSESSPSSDGGSSYEPHSPSASPPAQRLLPKKRKRRATVSAGFSANFEPNSKTASKCATDSPGPKSNGRDKRERRATVSSQFLYPQTSGSTSVSSISTRPIMPPRGLVHWKYPDSPEERTSKRSHLEPHPTKGHSRENLAFAERPPRSPALRSKRVALTSSDLRSDPTHQPFLHNERIHIKTEPQEISLSSLMSRNRSATIASEFHVYPGEIPLQTRGRNVPSTSFDDETLASSETMPSIPFGVRASKTRLADSSRRYICTFEGCGKCFVRGEHLKRHVKGVHLCERRKIFTFSYDVCPSHLRVAFRCPHDGCKKAFTRGDNLKQHILVCYSRPGPSIKIEEM
ncbi:uncharacterized protein EV420DRAFT_1530324 [Desarmillaria tabescens]|uniref:C2H2-type domain-containing protein n=1 Tax=Armillaria tabescens TaxID=1929756 RepID=A0AA39N8S3_ARMTA|nr:uncharacterized protein EV420DRAFT_1530324 [Desarmillaria tabescens]KAK0461109.1 hypothetical protein EV420DRAFT_1530324 [Desarmillaria tabescens]